MDFKVTVTRKKIKNIIIKINSNGEVLVSAPKRVPQKYIEQLIMQKEKWIIEKINSISQYYSNRRPISYVNGDEIFYLGKKYILEKPLRADVALLNGSVVDELGNVIYAKTTKNFNPMMATAADTVIVFAEKLVKVGEIDPDHVMTSRIFVDYIVK